MHIFICAFSLQVELSLFLADRTGERFFHICAPWWGVMVGYIIGVSTFSIGGRYVAMFLMASGYAGESDLRWMYCARVRWS